MKKQTRSSFIKTVGAGTAMALYSFRNINIHAGQANLPNIVFIMADQMRGDALSCLGRPNVKTPHIDRLAQEGVLFENFFSNNLVCVPSRVLFFSGRYPHQHGQLTNKSKKELKSIDNTLLGYFKSRGYRLGWVGKNHTYIKKILSMLDLGIKWGREPFRQYTPFVTPYWHSDTLWPKEKCHPKMTTDDGIEFINKWGKSEPFFLHLSYFDPHPPYMAPAEYSSGYCASDMKLPRTFHPGS